MSKLEEMVETFNAAHNKYVQSRKNMTLDYTDADRAGLLAVFEKHVKAMLAEGYAEALYDVTDWDARIRTKEAAIYASRIIQEIKG